MRTVKEIKARNRHRKVYTNHAGFNKSSSSIWGHIPFEHKASLETTTLDFEMKHDIIEDLLAFIKNKEFYESWAVLEKRVLALWAARDRKINHDCCNGEFAKL